MSLEYQSKLNQLLVLGKKNGLFFSDWLRKNGYSDQLIRKYRQSGWLATLDKGVMYRTGDSLSSFAALSCYNEQLNKNMSRFLDRLPKAQFNTLSSIDRFLNNCLTLIYTYRSINWGHIFLKQSRKFLNLALKLLTR